MKGFWNFIKGHNYVNSPSQVFNPEKLLVDTGDINKTSRFHYGSKFPAVTVTVFITILEQSR
jgi:hypothetical protein